MNPRGQAKGVHVEEPAAEEVPLRHSMHTADERLENVLASHCAQKAEPSEAL